MIAPVARKAEDSKGNEKEKIEGKGRKHPTKKWMKIP